jgi:hypothetical protein
LKTVTAELAQWDAFFTKEADRQRVEHYRVHDWRDILRHIREEHPKQYPLLEGHEPQWITPGSAMLWQQPKLLARVDRPEGGRVLQEQLADEWVPVGPVPVANASQVVQYLENGLRLRPPGVIPQSVDAAVETALSTEESAVPSFVCRRHPEKGDMPYPTWKGYIQHCRQHEEIAEPPFPDEVIVKQRQYRWYCVTHNRGYDNEQDKDKHVRMAQIMMPVHPILEAMERPNAAESGVTGRKRNSKGTTKSVGEPVRIS